jgi:SAM-dependent methyltransferase
MNKNTNRLYDDLAWLWPLWGDPTEYAQYCDHVTHLIRQYARRDARSLLNVGCGGGKNAFNLKRNFQVTGLDISPAMLDLARQLNPECRFLQGDMRDFSLDEQFDAVLIDDAICYMISEAELRQVFDGAYAHLKAGGVMIAGPDDTKEDFHQNRTRISHATSASKPENVDVVFIENDYDPQPEDDVYEATMIYLIRENGKLRVERDLHLLGLFSIDAWRKALRGAGFEIHEARYVEDEKEYVTFACVKPSNPSIPQIRVLKETLK